MLRTSSSLKRVSLTTTSTGQRDLGITAGFAWADAASLAVFYIDNGLSVGMANALQRCVEKGMKYEFRSLYGDVSTIEEQLKDTLKGKANA